TKSFERFRRTIFPVHPSYPGSPAGTQRTSAIDRWASMPMAFPLTRRQKRKETPSTAMMNGSGWKRCGEDFACFLTWWRQQLEHNNFRHQGASLQHQNKAAIENH